MKIIISNKPYRNPSHLQMSKNVALEAELILSGKPMKVLESVRAIKFKKNRSSQIVKFFYPGKPKNINKDIFEIHHGKILDVIYAGQEPILDGEEINNYLVKE